MKNDNHLLNRIITSILALVVVGGVFLLLYFIMFREKNAGVEKDLIVFVLGALTGWVGQILSYFFGSSQGSKEKTDLLNKIKEDENAKN